MKTAVRSSLALVALVLASCAPLTLVENKPVTVDGVFNVEPQMAWSAMRTNEKHITLWTVDGAALNSLMFFTDIADGEPLLPVPGAERKDLRLYRATMLPDDVTGLFAYYVARNGRQVHTQGLRPAMIGSHQAFRFEIAYVSEAGLKMRAKVLFAQTPAGLDAIMFEAPEEYYFSHLDGPVEQLFQTATLNG